jgi:hypothetical protein
MNHYKIDWNRWMADEYPYALYSRATWYRPWKHVASFRSKEEARALHEKLKGLPIFLEG